jgi:hypothetical protein
VITVHDIGIAIIINYHMDNCRPGHMAQLLLNHVVTMENRP